jgi:MFS family permease
MQHSSKKSFFLTHLSQVSSPAWFLASVITYMVPNGIQMVMVSYLMAIELNQSPGSFGITQMVGQLPLLLFLLMGGWVADRVDNRRWLMTLQGIGMIMPIILAFLIWRGGASEAMILLYAVVWGMVGAFSLPSRDGLLRRVAGTNVQRMVGLAIGTQFASQMVGQTLAGQATRLGTVTVLLIQAAIAAAGIFVASRLPGGRAPQTSARGSLLHELGAGLSMIARTPVLRSNYLVSTGMGVFFGGFLLVLIPLAVRDLYNGSAQDIASGYVMFAAGTMLSIAWLTQRGGLRRPGRALVMTQFTACAALLPISLDVPLGWFYLCIFLWGLSLGVGMTMSRTIMQEQAPASHQSRIMAALTLMTTGGGPLGAFMTGQAIAAVGVKGAVLLPIVGVLACTAASLATHSMIGLSSRSHA